MFNSMHIILAVAADCCPDDGLDIIIIMMFVSKMIETRPGRADDLQGSTVQHIFRTIQSTTR